MNHSIERAVRLVMSLWIVFGGALAGWSAGPRSSLESGFARPPDAARPWVYYFIMDGNLTREGITADFDAMTRAGIGGMIIMEVDAGIPRGPVRFMSAEWRQLFKHAVREAERLGLEITLNAGPGWTGSGGPWVKPEQSMQHVVASAVEVVGPTNLNAALPRPTPRAPYFGNAGLPAEMLKAKDDFYADVAVLAFPKVSETTLISDIDEKALYLRHPYSSRPGTKPFLPSPANHPDLPSEAVIPAGRIVDLTDRLQPNGRLEWNVPAGNWTILRFGRTSTGANTRPAPAPGLGLESDKFDTAALDAHFDAFIGSLLREIGTRREPADAGWNMLHIDSWEMGAQNWTAAFSDEFRRRRGYDPLRYLPAVTGRVVESLEVSERFLWDLRQTAQELVIENHAQLLKELGRRHGFGLSIEPYDMNPCSDMSLGAVADVPMCEFWLYGFNSTFSVIEAASIAHTLGRPIVAAEAFTSTDAERWQAHPASMKTLGDWAFCAGVNRIVFHRYQHQPWLDRFPGMTMGPYGVHWERTQTWWDMVPAYHQYLARCQFMLRQGLPVADICYLVAEGAPHVFRPPPSATRGHPPDRLGYNFDGCAPETLFAHMSVKDGRLVLPGGASYRVLVLPERDTMTPGLLRKVKELVEAGATVVGPRPLKSPSLSGYPKCDEEVKALANELWDGLGVPASAGLNAQAPEGGTTSRERRVGQGRVVWAHEATSVAEEDSSKALEAAKWIWYPEGNPAARVPVGKRFFRRAAVVPDVAAVASARMLLTADNAFELWVNGQSAGTGDNFHLAYPLDVTKLLQSGTNILAVVAENGGDSPNPAGLIGNLRITYQDGSRLTVPTDSQWQTALTAPAGWMTNATTAEGWRAAMDLGPAGMAPWGAVGQPATELPQYGDFSIVAGVLRRMDVLPDFESDGPLRYTHRRDGDADIYFVANREGRVVHADCTFRVSGKVPELWDPLTGQIRPLPEFTASGGRTTVPMRFESAQSFFVLFDKPATNSRGTGRNFTEPSTLATLSGEWKEPSADSAPIALGAPSPPAGERAGVRGRTSWEVTFDPKWGGPGAVEFPTLVDWAKRPEDGIRHYSGVATYRKTFDLPKSAIRNPQPAILLDLGVVRNLARVRLNGQDLGVVWCAPWRVDITGEVKPGSNELEIAVANLWPNRLIGDQSLPPEKRLTWTTWNPFKKDSPLLESGLLGPVTIQAQQAGKAESDSDDQQR